MFPGPTAGLLLDAIRVERPFKRVYDREDAGCRLRVMRVLTYAGSIGNKK